MADFERARNHYNHDPARITQDAALVHPALRNAPTKDAAPSLHSLKRALSNDNLSSLRLNDRSTMTPTTHARDQLGLPPTPPTLTNSDLAEPRGNTLATNPQFADAVRKALNSHTFEQQVIDTPTPAYHIPHTPDPTPPSARVELKPRPAPIRPYLALKTMTSHPRSSPSLTAGLSSQAESFHTAQESANTSQLHLAQELSPPASPLPNDRNDTSIMGSEDAQNEDGDGDAGSVGGTATPKVHDNPPFLRPLSFSLEFSDQDLEKHLRELKLVSDSPLIRRSKRLSMPSPPESPEDAPPTHITRAYIPKEEGISESVSDVTTLKVGLNPSSSLTPPPKQALRHTDTLPRSNITRNVSEHSADFGPPSGDMEKHITYLADDAEEQEPKTPVIVDSADDVVHQACHESSTEGLNNDVYREIRENNVKRHSAGGSLPVGIIIPHQPKHKLKRVSRYDHLRETLSEGPRSPGNSVGATRKLRHMKPLPVKSLEASPESDTQLSPRQPSAVDVQSSRMTSLTRDALAENEKEEMEEVPSIWRQHTLRRSSKTDRVESLQPSSVSKSELNVHKREDSDASQDTDRAHQRNISGLPQDSPRLRHFSKDTQLENNPHVRRTSLEVPIVRASVDSGRSQTDPRFLHPSATPQSTTVSYRTDAEVCEATGITLYPVNEDNAVQVVHHTNSQPLGPIKDNDYDDVELHFPIRTPPPEIMTRRRTMPILQCPEVHVGSPLTNSGEAPEPPLINFIPPTPSNELEVLLMDEMAVAPLPKRNVSLKDRARRYSESYIVPLFTRSLSNRRNAKPAAEGLRQDNLSPMWRPRYFWEDYESDEEYDEDDFESRGALPSGGDTSEVREQPHNFPRSMSVRMPGFRGNGGFLVGNSLGLERHGTNNRRHHIVTRRMSEEMLRGDDAHHRRRFLPLTSKKARRFQTWREQRQIEKRRATLRGQIQHHPSV